MAFGHATRMATLREQPFNLGLGLLATLREWPRYANNLPYSDSRFPTPDSRFPTPQEESTSLN
ncbi:MAG: hypothetical protein F6J98_30955 [Moorea sp. SIO4G2]|nr:hypothetical protein [Moorena sp. SIO4G2]